MIRWLRRLADGPDAPLCDQMRKQHDQPRTARVIYAEPDASIKMDNPRLKPRSLDEWMRRHGRKAG